MELSSNVLYKFSCPCDTAMSYIGYPTRHLITRVHEHLKLKKDLDTLVHITLKVTYL